MRAISVTFTDDREEIRRRLIAIDPGHAIAQAVELAERLREEGESRTADYCEGLAAGIEARAFGPADQQTRH